MQNIFLLAEKMSFWARGRGSDGHLGAPFYGEKRQVNFKRVRPAWIKKTKGGLEQKTSLFNLIHCQFEKFLKY